MGGTAPSDGLTVWECCSLAYTMAAEQADGKDRLLHFAHLMNGKEPDGSPFRDALDDWLRGD